VTFEDAPRCKAQNTSGEQCGAPAVRGARVCRTHGGSAPAVRRKAAIRATVMDWRVELPEVDPADQFRRLIAVTAVRQAELEWLIRTLATQEPENVEGPEDWRRLVAGYVGTKTVQGGGWEEYLRALAAAERAERELCAKLCTQAIAAGLDERRVRIMEEQARLIVGMFDLFADGLGLSDEQAARVPEVAERVLRSVPTFPDVSGELAG
jgi:hypothetical protein